MTTRCYFLDVEVGNNLFNMPIEMETPAIGSLVFIEGQEEGWRVQDVQYQLRRHPEYPNLASYFLIVINVLVKRVEKH